MWAVAPRHSAQMTWSEWLVCQWPVHHILYLAQIVYRFILHWIVTHMMTREEQYKCIMVCKMQINFEFNLILTSRSNLEVLRAKCVPYAFLLRALALRLGSHLRRRVYGIPPHPFLLFGLFLIVDLRVLLCALAFSHNCVCRCSHAILWRDLCTGVCIATCLWSPS